MSDKEQFTINDSRSLDDVVYEICKRGNIPSFCTACYRAGRTGEEFMKVAKTKFVHNFCIPNAILTFKEYIVDYASPKTKELGEKVIAEHLKLFEGSPLHGKLLDMIERTEKGEHDLRL